MSPDTLVTLPLGALVMGALGAVFLVFFTFAAYWDTKNERDWAEKTLRDLEKLDPSLGKIFGTVSEFRLFGEGPRFSLDADKIQRLAESLRFRTHEKHRDEELETALAQLKRKGNK
jgi:hypothetical protein